MRQIIRSALHMGLSVLAVGALMPMAHADTATDYNIFLLRDLNASNSDVEGRVAVGGNATLTNYSVGLKAPAGGAANALVVGGALKITNAQVNNGGIVAGSGSASGVTVVDNGVSSPNAITIGASPVDFTSEGARLQALSARLATQAANGTTSFSYGTLTFTGTQSGLNIFTLSGADLAAANGFNVILPTGSSALFNIDGTNDIFQNMGMALSGISDRNVLLNFYQATSLSISGIGVMGSILAPSADVTFNSGAINGNVIAGSLTGMGQVNYAPYAGTLLDPAPLAPPTAAVPEPTTWAMIICGFGLVGAMMRRRGRAARLA